MKQRILKHKKLIAFLVIYLVFLGWTLHAFSGSPPGNEVEIYKGCTWGFGLTDAQAREMKECGVNTYVIRPGVFMDSEGNTHELPFSKQYIIWQIQTAHRNGLQVFLDMKNSYVPIWVIDGGAARFAIPERLQPTFFEQYNKKVLEYAEIAEKYGVELFSPLSEPDGVFTGPVPCERWNLSGVDKASEWMQEILPKIRERYHGKVVWRGSITACGPEPRMALWTLAEDA